MKQRLVPYSPPLISAILFIALFSFYFYNSNHVLQQIRWNSSDSSISQESFFLKKIEKTPTEIADAKARFLKKNNYQTLLKSPFIVSDCVDALTICLANQTIFNPIGPGTDDFDGPNSDGCLSGEHLSVWYYFELNTDTPLGSNLDFLISPNSGLDDYDFAVWGPNVSCGDLGAPIRCSFAGQSGDTGLSPAAEDNSEGAGGDRFVNSLRVNPGDGFYMMIDNWSQSFEGFQIVWSNDGAPYLSCTALPCDLEVSFSPNVIDTIPGSSVTLFPALNTFDFNLEYTWSANPPEAMDYLLFPESLNPIVEVPEEISSSQVISYFLTVTQDVDCVATGSIDINVNVPVEPDSTNNDCMDALRICGEDTFIEPHFFSAGLDDFEVSDNEDGCLTGEHFSAWYRFQFSEDMPDASKLEFVMQPDNPSADLDFAIWGADVSCDQLGSPIRCSFADGAGANVGMIAGIGENSESTSGDGFVEALTVEPGQSYYIMIDLFTQELTGININWMGNAAEFMRCDDSPVCNLNVSIPPVSLDCSQGIATISPTVSGGNSPYSYLWSTGETSASIQVNTPDNYCVTVTDNEGCQVETCATFIENSLPTVLLDIEQELLCHGDGSGAITAMVTGGAAPYTYLWSNGATSPEISNLSAGDYSVTISDATTCEVLSFVTLNEPSALDIVVENITNTTSPNATDGSINISVSGGTQPYTYTWNQGIGNVQNPQSLAAGTYMVTVTDANACSLSISVLVNALMPLSIVSITPSHPSCTGTDNGQIQLEAVGGTAPYTYNWNNGAEDVQNPQNLAAGTYQVTVTDSAGATATGMTTLIASNANNIEVTLFRKRDINCFGDQTGSIEMEVTGNSSSYQYNWGAGLPNSQNLTQLAAGTYQLTVTDPTGCTAVSPVITITQPSPLMLATSSTPDSGGQNGTATVTASGGTVPYTYTWLVDDFPATSTIENLPAGTYDVFVEDRYNCFAFTQVRVSSIIIISEDNEETRLNISPNPSAGLFYIDLNIEKEELVEVEVFDIMGRRLVRLQEKVVGFHRFSVDLTGQVVGMYGVQIRIGDEVESRKLVLK